MKKATILVVDDEIANIEIMNATLEDSYDICFAMSGKAALDSMRENQPDLVLLDVMMPDMDGFAVCQAIKQDARLADIPVIFTTGLGDTEAETKGLQLGAIDYVTKPIHPSTLRARVGNHIEMKYLRDQLAQLAITDALTGLSNRRHLERTLSAECARLSRSNDWLSVIMLDIDFFKQFNDTYGHPAGDRCIMMVASALKRAVQRACDTSARYGGEEFACVLASTELRGAERVAREIRSQVSLLNIPHERSSVGSTVTVSIGVASARCEKGMSPELWIAEADRQLYRSKISGRDRISLSEFSNSISDGLLEGTLR